MDEFYKRPVQKSDGISKDASEPELFSNMGQYEEESYDEDEQSFPIVDDSYNMDEENDLIDLSKEESGFMGPLATYPSAEEERGLWKRYLKLRRIDEILGSETITVKTSGVGRIFFKIVEDISESVDLIEMLRGLSDIDELGDKIIEDSNNNTRTMVELFRLIQSSGGRSNTKAKSKSENSCCVRDLFGFIFIEMLNNIAFGTGNPNLVDKVVKATNGDTNDIRTRIYRLAINRELLPSSIMKLIDLKTPVIKLPQAAQGIQPIQFSKIVLNDYQSFINNIQVDGKAARDRLIETHLRLAMKRARVLANENSSMDVGDLFQEGSIGLIKAAKHFNPAWGNRFMSYAPYWVHQTIGRAWQTILALSA